MDMKMTGLVIYGLVLLILCVFVVRSFCKDYKLTRHIRWVIVIAALCVVVSIVQMWTENEFVANLTYGMYAAATEWLLVMMVRFVNDYCKCKMEPSPFPLVVVGATVVDNVQLLLNVVFGHAYDMQQITTEAGELFWRYDGKTAFYIHLFWCYWLSLTCIAILFTKMMKVPQMYKKKYGNILIFFGFVIVLDAIHLVSGLVIDITVLGFPMVAAAIYYYSVEYIPRAFVSRTLGLAIDEMTDGVLITDMENTTIYSNDYIKRFLELKSADADRFANNFDGWCKEHYQSPDENFVYDWTLETIDGEKHYLKVAYRILKDEHGMRAGSYINMQERTDEIQSLLRERYAATHDSLTGLYNADYFYRQAEQCLRMHPDERYLMICTDVRNFKMINDIFGTKAADQLLIDIGDMLRKQAIPGEVYGRLVNDRFALLMRKRDYREMTLASRSAEVMKIADEVSYPLRIYLGVYEIDDLTLPISAMCDRALLALETVKGDYQKMVAYYDEKLRYSVLLEQELAAGLDRAIREGEIVLYVQPQITVDGECKGGEALVRWNHPTKGLLLPGTFIEPFERNGLIVKLDLYVWELACKQLREWKDRGFGERYLSVNISPKDFFFVDIYKEFMKLVTRYGIKPSNIKLEITENAIMHDLPKQLALMKKLREAGFIVEMDDFGSGYSSLNMLKDIRVDMLKIDMEFLRASESEERSRTILKTVVALSKELGMPVITEGVETKDHVDFLTDIGCDIFQGYFFERPMKMADYEAKYLK